MDNDMWNHCISYVSWLYRGKIRIVEMLHEMEKKENKMMIKSKDSWDAN